MKKRLAIACIGYSVEFTPMLLNLATLSVERGYDVHVITDNLERDKDYHNHGFKVISMRIGNFSIRSKRLRKIFNKIRLNIVTQIFKLRYTKYDQYIAIEGGSLHCLEISKIPPDKILFVFLENTKILDRFFAINKKLPDFISKIPHYIIASKEREIDIRKKINLSGQSHLIPVSLRPVKQSNLTRDDEAVNVIYSGYFAEWAKVLEILKVFQRISNYNRLSLQGHHVGTDRYLQKVLDELSSNNNNKISIDTSYYETESHIQYLSGFSFGLALYGTYSSDDNWDNLIFSSNKIATYLWSGLPVVTNISHPITLKPPFIYIEDITESEMSDAIDFYLLNRKLLHESALKFAQQYYNFDLHSRNLPL
jgi:hypothetical protein